MKIPLAWKKLDFTLFGLTMVLAVMGVVLVYSAAYHRGAFPLLAFKQLGWVLVGLVALSFFYIIDYQALLNAAYPLYWLMGGLLLVVLAFGHSSRGSQRWINLGLFHFQPSEMAKLVVILSLCRWIIDHPREIRGFLGLVPIFLVALLPMILIIRQPDLGTALVILPIAFTLMFVGGARAWHLLVVLAGMALSAPLAWHFLKDYQRRRLLTFLNPQSDALGAGYNLIQSKIAIGSGGLWGAGFLKGTQSQLNFIPMHHTDFIFSVLGEEWGLAGCSLVLLLYLLLLLQCVKIAIQAKDLPGTLLSSGIIALLAAHIVINVGMTVGLLPVTGLTLPLLSYGGSSILLNMICIGILLNVRRESAGY